MADSRALKITYCGLFSALIAVCSWITVPSAVPFTLQTFGVFLAVGVLGGKLGMVSVAVYIALGAIGVPVFSSFKGGVGVLLGQTGGYIWGFILGTAFMWLCERLFGRKTAVFIFSAIPALILTYTAGTLWYIFGYTRGEASFFEVLKLCVFPFLLPDLVKLFIALKILKRVKNVDLKG